MLIRTDILYCDGTRNGGACPSRLLIRDASQPFIEALDHGWKMDHAKGFKHYFPKCKTLLKEGE